MTAITSLPRLHRLSRFAAPLTRRSKGARRRRLLFASLALSALVGALFLRGLGSLELGIDSVLAATSYAFWLGGGLATLEHLGAPGRLTERVAELRGFSAGRPLPRALGLGKSLLFGFAFVALPALAVLAMDEPRVWGIAGRLLVAAAFLAASLATIAWILEATKVRYPRAALAIVVLAPIAVDPYGDDFPHLARLTAKLLDEARPPLEGLE